MARVALISDIHANLEAFEATLADIARADVDSVACLGDVVGYGPDPSACVALALDACDVIVLGNHEEAALRRIDAPRFNPNAQRSTDYTRGALSDSMLRAISRWPLRAAIEGIALTHASFGPEAHEYLYSPAAALRSLRGFTEAFGAVGHTHMPSAFALDAAGAAALDAPDEPSESGEPKRATKSEPGIRACLPAGSALVSLTGCARCLVNPGSVGQPRDKDPRAAWAILDTGAATLEVRRVAYDAQAVRDKIRRAGLPERLGERLLIGA